MKEKCIQEKPILKKRQLILIAAAAIMLSASCIAAHSLDNPKLSNADFIRLHVLANSNTYEDQVLKLKVRDACLALLSEEMTKLAHKNDAKDLTDGKIPRGDVKVATAYIRENFDRIQKAAEDTMAENGYAYKAEVFLAPRWIPEKTYGKTIFPAGEYETLTINIGKAEGNNWWCVLFPPLCLIDTTPSANVPGEDAVKIEVKFKSAEVLKKILE